MSKKYKLSDLKITTLDNLNNRESVFPCEDCDSCPLQIFSIKKGYSHLANYYDSNKFLQKYSHNACVAMLKYMRKQESVINYDRGTMKAEKIVCTAKDINLMKRSASSSYHINCNSLMNCADCPISKFVNRVSQKSQVSVMDFFRTYEISKYLDSEFGSENLDWLLLSNFEQMGICDWIWFFVQHQYKKSKNEMLKEINKL